MKRASLFRVLSLAAAGIILPSAVWALNTAEHPHKPDFKSDGKVVRGWAFAGPTGRYDKRTLQRGFKVYREICSSCHALEYMSFRNLGQHGGPFDVEECYGQNPSHPDMKSADPVLNQCVKAIAATFQVPAGPDEFGSMVDEEGRPLMRPAKPSDPIPGPYQNVKQAKAANNGKAPPNLSLITLARHDGPSYVYSLITGFPDKAPEGLNVPTNLHYNPYFPGDTSGGWSGPADKKPIGGFIGMTPPLVTDGQVAYDDGTEATIHQMAYDVVNFLQWAAEPKMEARKQTGIAVIGYLFVLALLLYWSYRRIWRDVKH